MTRIGLIGFGEAGRTFFVAGGWVAACRVYDIKTDQPGERAPMLANYAAAGGHGCETLAEAIGGAEAILSLVTADQALDAAAASAARIAPGALYCDMNSVAPQTKRSAASLIVAAGAHYVDVAVMAPVEPAGLSVPLLLSGEQAARAAAKLTTLGFTDLRVVGEAVGRASSIKMIRSVMVKGLEALTAECVLAAEAAGVLGEVLSSLDASERPRQWAARADYDLGRMMIHGVRRAAEMDEAAKTLETLGTGNAMTRATVERQRAIGRLGLRDPAAGLNAKLAQLVDRRRQAA